MQLMKKKNEYFLLGGAAQYFDGDCILSSYQKKPRKGKRVAYKDNREACFHCLNQAMEYSNPLTYTRGKSEKEIRQNLIAVLWDCETTHREYPRFTRQHLEEFVEDLVWDGYWIMPKYAEHLFTNPVSSSGILLEFVSKGSQLVYLLSAFRFHKVLSENPNDKKILKDIFQRLDFKHNPHEGQVVIAYPHHLKSDYVRIFSLLGYSFVGEQDVGNHNVLSMYRLTRY